MPCPIRRLVLPLGLLLLLGRAGWAEGPLHLLRPGDFVYTQLRGAAGDAIRDSSDAEASHCGIVARDAAGELTVIHAYGRVREEPLAAFLAKSTGSWSANRLAGAGPEVVKSMVATARGFLGWPYDRQYLVTNRSLYCSELLWRVLRDGPGLEPVALTPMDFASDGPEVWEFWVRFFQGEVPQGEPGIAPGDYLGSAAFVAVYDGLASSPSSRSPSPAW